MPVNRKIINQVTCMAVGLVLILIFTSGLYWSNIAKPILKNDMQALTSAMASARANELSVMLERDELNNEDIEKTLFLMLAYSYERNQQPFFIALDLELDPAFKLQHKIEKNVFHQGEAQCDNCFSRDYPMYSSKNHQLIGILNITMSNTQANNYIYSVQRLFLTGVSIIIVSSMVVLALIANLTRAMGKLNENLEQEVSHRTRSLKKEIEEHNNTQIKLHSARDEMQRLERKRIANTLHDGVGQTLQAIKLGLQHLSMNIATESREIVNELVVESGEAISIIRDFCAELRPLHLEKISLGKALFSHVDRLDRRIPNMSLSIKEVGKNKVHLPMPVKEQFFLIASELLNNAIKHSEASKVSLLLDWSKDTLAMTIVDNGKGLEPASAQIKGIGLSLVRERCERLGATFQMDSPKNTGVIARCELKINKDEYHDNKITISG